jgi:hypothetical protein
VSDPATPKNALCVSSHRRSTPADRKEILGASESDEVQMSGRNLDESPPGTATAVFLVKQLARRECNDLLDARGAMAEGDARSAVDEASR